MRAQPSSTTPDVTANAAVADTHHYRRVLHDLIDLGAEFARMVHAEAKAHADARDAGAAARPGVDAQAGRPTPILNAAIAFDRVARCIRRTIALARRLDDPLPPSRGAVRTAARRRIIRGVEDAIQRWQPGACEPDGLEEAAAGLTAELAERMDGPDLEDDIGQRPVAEIIAEICRDLGLGAMPGTRPWQRRTPADIAALCARAAAPPGAGPQPSDMATVGNVAEAEKRPCQLVNVTENQQPLSHRRPADDG